MKISVITVCYNAVSTISATIQSLIDQDYENVEYIVIDGASDDGTNQIIQKYHHQIKHYVSEPDCGMYGAMNKGLALATGEIIGFLHADDIFASNDILTKIASTMHKNKVDAVYGDLVFINYSGKAVRKWKSKPCSRFLLELGWMPPHPTLYVKKTVYNQSGNYLLNFSTAADYELILRFFYRYQIKTHYINTVFVKMLTGGLSNKTILSHVKGNRNDLKAMKLHNLRAPFIAVIFKPLQKIIQYF